MRRSRFVAPKRVESFEDVRKALQLLQEQLDATQPKRPSLITKDTTLRAGESVRISPRGGATLFAKLPKASAENFGQSITLLIERPKGTVRVCAQSPDTVVGASSTNFTTAGLVVLISNGVDAWCAPNELPSTSPAASALDAEYVLGAAHASLPNGIEPTAALQVPVSDGTTAEWDYPLLVGTPFAWIFDGVDDRVNHGDVLDMTRTTARSMFLWYATTTTGNVAIGKQSAANQAGYRFAVPSSSADQDIILAGPAAAQQIQCGANPRPPSDGSEHHFGWTYNGNSSATGFTFYTDGTAVGRTNGTNNLTSADTTNAQDFQIGRRGTDAHFSGGLRHISIWNRELTAAEVAQIYGGGAPPDLSALSFFADCILWVKLDETDATGAGGIADHSASNFDGTAAGGLAPTGGSDRVHTITGDSTITATVLGASATLGRAALTGDIEAAAGSNVTAIGAGVIVNADVNASAAIAQTKLGATTGFSVKASGASATTSAEPIVTYSASANMSAERVTTSSTSITVDTSVASQIEFRRAALTGAVSAAANANTTQFAGIRDNGTLETARGFVNVLSTSTITALITQDAGNDEQEWTWSVNLAAAYTWTGNHTHSAGNWTMNSAGDFDVTAAAVGVISNSTMLLDAVGDMTLQSDGNVIVQADALYLDVDGFLLLESSAASTPSVGTNHGLFWVVDGGASAFTLPRYTDDNSNDRYIQLSFDVVQTSAATGAIGTVALRDEENVFRWNGGANGDISGFSGNLWNGRQLLVRNASGTAGRTLTINHDSAGTAAHGVHGPANTAVVVRNRGSTLLTYDTTSSRWFHTIV